jgi:hypothetical protein
MSPVVSTRAGASAGAYGWTRLSLGGGYWVLKSTLTSAEYMNIAVDSAENLYVKYDYAHPSYSGYFAPTIAKVDYDGIFQWTKQYTPPGAYFNSYSGGLGVLNTGNIAWGIYSNSGANTKNYLFAISSAGSEVFQKSWTSTFNNSVGRGFSMSPNGAYLLLESTTNPSLGPMLSLFDSAGSFYGSYGSTYATQVHSCAVSNAGAQAYSTGSSGYMSSASTLVWANQSTDLTTGAYFNSSGDLFGFGQASTAYTAAGAGKLSLTSGTTTTWARGLTIASGGGFGGNAFGGTYLYSIYQPYVSSTYRTMIVKRNQSDGTIVWQREFAISGVGINTGNSPYYNMNMIAVDPTDKFMWIQFRETATPGVSYIFKLPTDGSKTGSYTVGGTTISYSASTYTDAARTLSRTTASPTVSYYSDTSVATSALTFTNGTALSTSKTVIT